MSAPPSVDLSSALLVIFSLVLALYLPSLLYYVRAWFMLQRIPSPPVDHLISGHTKSLTQLKRHKHEQECIAATGQYVYRLRVFGKHVRWPQRVTSPISGMPNIYTSLYSSCVWRCLVSSTLIVACCMQRVVIADPTLLQEFFAAEREGAVEKPDEQPFPLGHVRSFVK